MYRPEQGNNKTGRWWNEEGGDAHAALSLYCTPKSCRSSPSMYRPEQETNKTRRWWIEEGGDAHASLALDCAPKNCRSSPSMYWPERGTNKNGGSGEAWKRALVALTILYT